MTDQRVLTVTQAAAYLGMARQTIATAAKRGDIGTKREALGTRDGWIYVFTPAELDAWATRPRHPGGRPKSKPDRQPEGARHSGIETPGP